MSQRETNRREFLKEGLAAGLAVSGLTAASYGRVIGANERIRVGLIGCGGRGRYIAAKAITPENGNATIAAACDIFKSRLQIYLGNAEQQYGAKPKAYADYRRVLDDGDVDAVIIATPDHQHIGMTIDAVRAGKHVYVEKPLPGLACDLPDMNRCYDVVKASKMVVQHGTQGASSIEAKAIRKVIEEGRLGKLFRVESTENHYVPYWMHYSGPAKEEETDWKAFLYNRPARPFDANLHAKWMGYSEITSGTIGGWMSHFVNLVHVVTGCAAPVSAVAWGGRYAPTNDPKCTAPDQTAVLLDYAEGFHTQFTSHFGSDIDNEKTIFMFEKGSIQCKFGHWPGNPTLSSAGVDDKIKPEKLLDADTPDPLPLHVKNWLDCIRSGEQPNAHMDLGYKHGIAVILGDVAWTQNRKAYFDPKKREVHT